jgi:hypothetical protein
MAYQGRSDMTKFALVASMALIAGLFAGNAPANAFTIIGTEDNVNGFVGDLFPSFGYLVASDGESNFDPFSAGFDTSDGLNFSAVVPSWTQAAGSIWTNIGFQTWVLPANLTGVGCGSENEPSCEPIGDFVSPVPWANFAIGTWVILEADGSVSDVIKTFNNANGEAELWFSSDPSLLAVPEPSTWAMMLVGFAGLGYAGYRVSRKSGAIAA